MPDLGPHAVFIWGAYGVTLVAVTALTALIVADDRHQRALLAALEQSGVTRRSAKPAPPSKASAKAAAPARKPRAKRK